MKKKMLYIFCILLIAGLILALVIFGVRKHQDSASRLSNSLFQVSSYSDLEAVAQSENVSIDHMEMSHVVREVDAFGESMTFSYWFDSDDRLSELAVYCALELTDVEQLKEKIPQLLNGFAALFNRSANKYYVYSATEVFDCEDEQSIAKVFADEAVIEFRVRDKDSSYWVAKITSVEPGVFLFTVEHYINDSRFGSIPVNIDLS